MNIAKQLACMLAMSIASTAFAKESVNTEHGKATFQHYCAPCHGVGVSADRATLPPGTYALTLKYKGAKPAALEQRTDLSALEIKTFVRNGFANMPPFRKTEVTDRDIEAIAAYLAQAAKSRSSGNGG